MKPTTVRLSRPTLVAALMLDAMLLLSGCSAEPVDGSALSGAYGKATARKRCQDLEPDEAFDQSEALQDCLDRASPGARVELTPGAYRLDHQVKIVKPLTLTSTGDPRPGACRDEARCAKLVAGPDFSDSGGILRIGNDTLQVTIDHLIVDGNRKNRLASNTARLCLQRASGSGWDAGFAASGQCNDCVVRHSVFENALCGTGLQIRGRNLDLVGNVFRDNGDHSRKNGMVADGLTIGDLTNGRVEYNEFRDNSDVDLILGGAPGARVRYNVFTHLRQPAWAALMLDNFAGATSGDFRDFWAAKNEISCGGLCDFGIEYGPGPWYVSEPIFGGSLAYNKIEGAKIQVNVSRGGTAEFPVHIYENDLRGTDQAASFHRCGTRQTSPLNIETGSVVKRHGESWGATTSAFSRCY